MSMSSYVACLQFLGSQRRNFQMEQSHEQDTDLDIYIYIQRISIDRGIPYLYISIYIYTHAEFQISYPYIYIHTYIFAYKLSTDKTIQKPSRLYGHAAATSHSAAREETQRGEILTSIYIYI